jgi:nitroimidazol reductase NimA-like FMN-containing flavoprotein (pyridoxamine 5'-phosphate oxidase superfamily)
MKNLFGQTGIFPAKVVKRAGRPIIYVRSESLIKHGPAVGPNSTRETPMLTPVTKLDQRFSDPAATAAGWEQTRAVLENAELSWVSTVRADGRPHVTPVVAVWAEDAVCFVTGAGEQKFVNLQSNPHVVLTTGSSDWDHGLDVVVEGDAVPVTDEAALKRIAEAFTARWDGRWQWEVRDGSFQHPAGGAATLFAVTPVKVFAHAKGDPFGATTHKF